MMHSCSAHVALAVHAAVAAVVCMHWGKLARFDWPFECLHARCVQSVHKWTGACDPVQKCGN